MDSFILIFKGLQEYNFHNHFALLIVYRQIFWKGVAGNAQLAYPLVRVADPNERVRLPFLSIILTGITSVWRGM